MAAWTDWTMVVDFRRKDHIYEMLGGDVQGPW